MEHLMHLSAEGGYLTLQIEGAQAAGELPGLDDAVHLAFEIGALYSGANSTSLMHDSAIAYRRAEGAIGRRLLDAAPIRT